VISACSAVRPIAVAEASPSEFQFVLCRSRFFDRQERLTVSLRVAKNAACALDRALRSVGLSLARIEAAVDA